MISVPFFGPKEIAVGLFLIPFVFVATSQEPTYSRKYMNPAFYGGLFYVEDVGNKSEVRALVISYDDKPIEPKPNEPAAPTIPGFYLFNGERYVRYDFEAIEVIEKEVHFKTRSTAGESFEFAGTSGLRSIKDFNPSIKVPFIDGLLTRFKDGKIVKREQVRFCHAVIA